MVDPVRRSWGGLAALVGVAMFVATVLALHWLQPDYQPTQQLMSELALGPHGGAMIVAFCGLALAVFGIQASLAGVGASWGFRAVLVVASVLFLASGVFPLGDTSEIHIGAIAGAFVFSVLAMYLFPSSAGSASIAAPRKLSWTLAAGVALGVFLGHSVLPMGVGQRLAAACLVLWLAIVSWRLRAR